MRELDQLRERSDETMGRKLGLFALAGVLSVAALIAIGMVDGDTSERELASSLGAISQLALTDADPKAPAPSDPAQVELARLSFPATLAGVESAIEATVRSADLEHAALTTRAGDLAGARPKPTTHAPASTLASPESERLQRVAKHDPLVARALPERAGATMAAVGGEGPYTLQVVSYEARDEAERFVHALRTRGHRAFVALAEVPGRSRYFRVRVGPFATRREAVDYQTRFEQAERMHTLVVAAPAPAK